MKTGVIFTLASVFLAIGIGVTGCADRYAGYRRVLENEKTVLADFISEARQSVDADALAADVEKLTAGLRGLAGRLNEAEPGLPEPAELSAPLEDSAVPGELKADVRALELTIADLDKLLSDKEKLFSDPKVKKALEKLMAVRGSLGL